MLQKHTRKIITTSALVLAVCMAFILVTEHFSIMNGREHIVSNHTATIYDGDAEYGVLLLSDNRQKDTAFIDAFTTLSVTVMHSDYTISKTENDPVAQINDLVSAMCSEVGIAVENIAVVATENYSTDALRRALTVNDVLGTAVVEPIVSIDDLVNYGIFSCTFQRSPVLVAGHSWDANGQEESYVDLYNLLSADSISYNGRPQKANRNDISLVLSPVSVSSNIMISNEIVESVVTWVSDDSVELSSISSFSRDIKPLIWIFSLLSLIILLFVISPLCLTFYHEASGVVSAEVKSKWAFFLSRAVIWIVALPMMLVVWLGLYFLKVPLGHTGLIFSSYLLSSTLTIGILYRKGMIGIKGTPNDIKPVYTLKGVALSALLFTTVILTGLILGYSSMWGFEFSVQRHIFNVAMIITLSVGFIYMLKDEYMLAMAVKSEFVVTGMMLIPYLPLIALIVILVPMGMIPTSILVGKLFIWLIISILTAKIIKNLTGGVLIAAIAGAVCFAPFLTYQIYI